MSALAPALAAAVLATLFEHECRSEIAVAETISFAEDGESGGSFGKLQNDCHTNPDAAATLKQILAAALVPLPVIGRILGAVTEACKSDPLAPSDRKLVNAALASTQGRAATAALDQRSLLKVLAQLDRCSAAAATNGDATIAVPATLGLAIWINASGAPTTVLCWLEGQAITEYAGVPARVAPGHAVNLADLVGYLQLTLEMSRRPSLITDLTRAVAVGQATLPAAG